MAVGPDSARQVKPEQWGEVDALLEAAFGRRDEVKLVHRLRADGCMVEELGLSWRDGQAAQTRIGAYAAMSRMVAPANWFCLAPVAVWPDWQNGALGPEGRLRNSFRFGSRLVGMVAMVFDDLNFIRRAMGKAGLLQGDEPPTLVVLGKPSFYSRAGFSLERAARLKSPYPVDHTLIARPGDDVPEAELIYPAAFDGV